MTFGAPSLGARRKLCVCFCVDLLSQRTFPFGQAIVGCLPGAGVETQVTLGYLSAPPAAPPDRGCLWGLLKVVGAGGSISECFLGRPFPLRRNFVASLP